jgi:hypothetical protein
MRPSLNNKLFYLLYAALVAVFLTGCGQWQDEYDFRNYLRDKHPYSEIKETNLGSWCFQVNDTLKNQIWIYESHRSESSVRGHCVNCD